jgi:hypothetical protein
MSLEMGMCSNCHSPNWLNDSHGGMCRECYEEVTGNCWGCNGSGYPFKDHSFSGLAYRYEDEGLSPWEARKAADAEKERPCPYCNGTGRASLR